MLKEFIIFSNFAINYEFIFITDPFADAAKGDDSDVQDGLVHIRIQQRNGRKTLTTIQGLSSDYDLKKIVRACKKVSIHIHEFLANFTKKLTGISGTYIFAKRKTREIVIFFCNFEIMIHRDYFTSYFNIILNFLSISRTKKK